MCSIMTCYRSSVTPEGFLSGFERTKSRGPDDSRIVERDGVLLAFHRLAIMGLTSEGMQPFERDGSLAVCNGEIYGFGGLKAMLSAKGYAFASDSDCEILLPLWFEYGPDMFPMLDAEFACVIWDGRTKEFVAARDPIGIRPLYYGQDEKGCYVFSSEPKSLVGICARIRPFPPGHYAVIDAGPAASEPAGQERKKHVKDHGSFSQDRGPQMVLHEYRRIWQADHVSGDDMGRVAQNIHDRLLAGIEKRLDADAPLGFLLSGGLDSSLVCAISARIVVMSQVPSAAITVSREARTSSRVIMTSVCRLPIQSAACLA